MRTLELTGAALDWAVAKCEGITPIAVKKKYSKGYILYSFPASTVPLEYSSKWAQGGPIIERECIGLRGPSIRGNAWAAFIDLSGISQGPQHRHTGPTPLIAAMRCYVESKLGHEVDIPEELAK
jgi:hypothetical protein